MGCVVQADVQVLHQDLASRRPSHNPHIPRLPVLYVEVIRHGCTVLALDLQDPVVLPDSGITLDRSTITRHLSGASGGQVRRK